MKIIPPPEGTPAYLPSEYNDAPKEAKTPDKHEKVQPVEELKGAPSSVSTTHLSTDDGSSEKSSSIIRPPQRCRHWVGTLINVTVILLIVAGVVVGFVFAGIQREKKRAQLSTPDGPDNVFASRSPTSPTIAPVTVPVPSEPSVSAEQNNTFAPGTNAPSSTPTTVEITIHPYFFIMSELIDPNDLRDAATPQSRALKWVVNHVSFEEGMFSRDHLFQSFGLMATLYGMGYEEHTHGGEFASDYCRVPPIQNESVNVNVTTHLNETATANESVMSKETATETFVIVCSNDTVEELRASRMGLDGTIGSELAFLSSLKVLDAGFNSLQGTIPEELYSLTNLTHLYLNSNHLTGTLSDNGFSSLMDLQQVFLGSNQLQGPFPDGLRSNSWEDPRPLQYLSLFNNSISGSLPENMFLRRLFYLDLSFNTMNGTIPVLLDFFELRHLYLDHNRFTGTVPASLPYPVGRGRLIELTLQYNYLTGSFPGGWDDQYNGNLFMNSLKIENNNFTEELSNDVCDMYVFAQGEMVDLTADCTVCVCRSGCESCTL